MNSANQSQSGTLESTPRPMSPSRMYCEAAGVAPLGDIRSQKRTVCAMCGTPIWPGDLCKHARGRFNESFNNKIDLVLDADHICGHCMALWGPTWMQNYSKSFATSTGVYKFASNLDQAALIYAPPSTPYVVVRNTARQQHQIWRAPINYSTELMLVRFGDEVLSIRRRYLFDRALPALKQLTDMMTAQGMKGLPAIFDRDLARFSVGSVRNDVARRAKEIGQEDAVHCLNAMSMGEWWALSLVRQFEPSVLAGHKHFAYALPSGERFSAPKDGESTAEEPEEVSEDGA